MVTPTRSDHPSPLATRGPKRPRRPGWLWAAGLGALLLVALAPAIPVSIPTGPDAAPGSLAPSTPGDGPTTRQSGYLTDPAGLRERARLARQGVEPYASAVADLLDWAERAVDWSPNPVERLRIKGTEGPFVEDTAAAYGLALAWTVTGDDKYAEAAARFIMAWVDTTVSTERTCPDDGACQTSLIISRTVPGFVFAADLLEGSAFLTADEEERLRRWLRDLMLPTASELDNNWGDAGTFTRIVLSDYLGDDAGFEAAIGKWRQLMDLVAADGHIPEEVARGRAGLGYTQEALDYKVASAAIAGRRAVDLWSYVGAEGGSLKPAIDYLARYMTDDTGWPWSERVRRRAPSAFWEIAYARWQEASYEPLVAERRPHGHVGHSAIRWTTLTNGVAFGDP